MTNTKFRKRALLSSVAMLLVALVALGSATFAWFTSNPNAEAHGISMKTTAAAGLVIRTDTDSTWDHSAILNNEGGTVNLNPASQEQSTPANFWTVIADNSSNYGAKSSESMAPGTRLSDFYSEKVYFRLSDGSDASANSSQHVYISGITINPNQNATMENAVRVSIADASGTLLGTWALSTAGAHGTLTTAAQATGSFSPALAVAATGLDIDTNQSSLPATANTSKYVTVYVYLDGQDTDCYSDKVGTVNAEEIISSIQVDFTLHAPAQSP